MLAELLQERASLGSTHVILLLEVAVGDRFDSLFVLLRALSRRDMYVSELMETVGMDGKTASHHLEVLSDAGLIDSYWEGRRRYYRLVRDVRLEISRSPERRFVVQFSEQKDD